MSRQELAEAINLYLWQHHQIVHQWDETDIGRLERGENRWPGRRRREAFRAVLQVAADHEIGFYIRRSSTATSDATAVDQLVLAQLEPSAEQLLHGSGVGRGEWSSFAVVTSMLAQQRQAVPPSALLSLVEAHRDCLLTLYRKAGSDSIKADIGAMLGEASIVASRLWSAQGNHAMALAHCGYARTLADRSGDVRLAAVARIFESNLHSGASTLIHADGDIMTGLRLLDEASAAGPQLTAAARARIAAEQAQAYAALRLPRQAKAALDQARQHAAAITDDDRTGLFSDWNTTRVQVYEGTCYLLLDEPTVAIEHLENAAAALGEDEGNLKRRPRRPCRPRRRVRTYRSGRRRMHHPRRRLRTATPHRQPSWDRPRSASPRKPQPLEQGTGSTRNGSAHRRSLNHERSVLLNQPT